MAQKRNKNTRKHKKKSADKAVNQSLMTPKGSKSNLGSYGYTLQAIPCDLTEAETREAQLEIFKQNNKVSPKVWIILSIISIAGIAGIYYFKGMQTIFFWLFLVGVALYLLVKFVGMKLYVKRELDKQPFPDELKNIQLGLQPHGLVLSMPQELAMQQMQQQMGGKSNKSMMTMMKKNAGRDIPWSAMTDWKETDNFYMVMFELQGQQGSQIIPKRMANNNFPIEKLAEHLKESVPQSS